MDKQEYRDWRKSLGFTQAQLAEQLGLTRETIIRRETGKRSIAFESELACRALTMIIKGEV